MTVSYTGKYYQITVPDFASTPIVPKPMTGSTSELMTSFLRLGAADSGTEPGTHSADLIGVINDAFPSNRIADIAALIRAPLTVPSVDSINEIANQVSLAIDGAISTATLSDTGQAAALASLGAAAGTTLPSSTSAATSGSSDALDAACDAIVAAASGTFVDDARLRGDNATMVPSNGHTLTVSDRLDESGRLLTKGGWRDHSDGNRISTTYGDKVEVIRGNFRLVVLGRQNDAGNSAIDEWSGGLMQDNDCAPGAITEIKWVETEQGTWRVLETTTKGDVDTTFDGHVVERFLGGTVTTLVGREDMQSSSETALTVAELSAIGSDFRDALETGAIEASTTFLRYLHERGYPVQDGQTETSVMDILFATLRTGYDASESTATQSFAAYLAANNFGAGDVHYDLFAEGTNSAGKPTGGNPVVFEQTWATRIESYSGSSSNKVPSMTEVVWAGDIYSETNADSITENVTSGSITTTTTVTSDGTITETISAHEIHTNVGSYGSRVHYIQEMVYAEHRLASFYGGNAELNWEGFFEMFMGSALSLRVGFPSIEMSIALAAEIFIGVAFEVFVGQKFEINLNYKKELGPSKDGIFLISNWLAARKSITGAQTNVSGAQVNVGGPPTPPSPTVPTPPTVPVPP